MNHRAPRLALVLSLLALASCTQSPPEPVQPKPSNQPGHRGGPPGAAPQTTATTPGEKVAASSQQKSVAGPIGRYIQELASKDEGVRQGAAEALRKIGPPAVEPLIAKLQEHAPVGGVS